MVYTDPFQVEEVSSGSLAKPMNLLPDRLKAFVFDFFLLLPIVSFLLMPFYRLLEKSVYAQPEAMQSFTLWFSFLGLSVLVLVTVLASFLIVITETEFY